MSYKVDATVLFELIDSYARLHDSAITCGGEYIYQNDGAQVDAVELVARIFDKAIEPAESVNE